MIIGTRKKRRLVNVSELTATFGKEWCTTLLGFCVFTGEDFTSAFKGKGKVSPLKKLLKTPRFHKVFRWGSMWCFVLICAWCSHSCWYLWCRFFQRVAPCLILCLFILLLCMGYFCTYESFVLWVKALPASTENKRIKYA